MWTGLPEDADRDVYEVPILGCTPSYQWVDGKLIIENTKTDNPGGGVGTDPGTNPDPLSKTGQLKWPIPVLALTGVLLFALGWSMTFLKKRRR